MQPISLNVILSRVSTRNDGSLSLNFSTSEMDFKDTTVLIKLCRINLKMLLTPVGEQLEDVVEVKGEFDRKTPSQRLRAVLFLKFTQEGSPGTFEAYYLREMERRIQEVKIQLVPT